MQHTHLGFAQQIQQANLGFEPAIQMTASSFPCQSQHLERNKTMFTVTKEKYQEAQMESCC
jgi:hypothetical protein